MSMKKGILVGMEDIKIILKTIMITIICFC